MDGIVQWQDSQSSRGFGGQGEVVLARRRPRSPAPKARGPSEGLGGKAIWAWGWAEERGSGDDSAPRGPGPAGAACGGA